MQRERDNFVLPATLSVRVVTSELLGSVSVEPGVVVVRIGVRVLNGIRLRTALPA